MPTLSRPVPVEFQFLADIPQGLSFAPSKWIDKIDQFRVHLSHTSSHKTFIEFDDKTAIINLDTRFIDAIADLVSCLRLGEKRPSRARAYLVLYNLALDLAISAKAQAITTGLASDFLVSRATIDVEIAHVTDPKVDLAGTALKTVSEIAAKFISAHELMHWRLGADESFRSRAIKDAKQRSSQIAASSKELSDSFKDVFAELAAEFETLPDNAPLPHHLEEWICDYLAADSMAEAIQNSAEPPAGETTLFASSLLIWARSRLLALFKDPHGPLNEIDLEMIVKRSSAVMSALLGPKLSKSPAIRSHKDLDTPHLDQMDDLAKHSLSTFFDGQNIARLIAIGTASEKFGLSSPQQTIDFIKKVRDWE